MTYAMLVVVMIIHAIDLMTTYRGIKHGLIEANPIWRSLFDRFGVYSVGVTVKVLLSIPLVLLVLGYPRHWLSYAVAGIYIAVGALVLRNNLKVLRDVRGG